VAGPLDHAPGDRADVLARVGLRHRREDRDQIRDAELLEVGRHFLADDRLGVAEALDEQPAAAQDARQADLDGETGLSPKT